MYFHLREVVGSVDPRLDSEAIIRGEGMLHLASELAVTDLGDGCVEAARERDSEESIAAAQSGPSSAIHLRTHIGNHV